MKKLINELQLLQNEVIDIVCSISEENYYKQFHPDLSPIGWHLGHCIYTELYWIEEQLLSKETISDSLKSLYVPELSQKSLRGSVIPEKDELLVWAKQSQAKSCSLLQQEIDNKNPHHLLSNNYLIHFLIQHYAQHLETMNMVMTEIQLQQNDVMLNEIEGWNNKESNIDTETIVQGPFKIGLNDINHSYDNERPKHTVKLDSFKIATLPVSNSQYLNFIDDDAYKNNEYWSSEGWHWLTQNQFKHPHHWRLNSDSNYFGINDKGAFKLDADSPVYGLSYYEAEAYARWHGARLPHEHEWEVAKTKNLLQQTSLVWEWCSNPFYPYENFSAYPYEGYSVPYFDNKHYVLRGGSRYSNERIKRASFRNYYTAEKRHIFAGLRLAYD